MTRAGAAPGTGAAEALLAHPFNMAPDEWMLVATLLVEAAEAVEWSEAGRNVRNERFDRIVGSPRISGKVTLSG